MTDSCPERADTSPEEEDALDPGLLETGADELAADPSAGNAEVTRPCLDGAASADESLLASLIGRVVGRDESALSELYRLLIGRVFGLALRITRQAQTAEEVAEDCFWQIWREAPRFDPERGSPLVWVMTLARSRALDALRRAKRPEMADSETVEAAQDELPGGSDPQDLLAAVERKHRLHAALTKLDPLPRQLLALAFFRGLSQEEIALHTGMPLGTVKSSIRRAQARLRELLSPDQTSPLSAP